MNDLPCSNLTLPLVLIGGGGHCQSCIDVLEAVGGFEIKAVVDKPEMLGKQISGYQINHTDEDLPELLTKYQNTLLCLGQIKSSEPRRSLFEKIKALGGNLITPVSPLAYVSPTAQLGAGTIVMHHALINAGAQVGFGCIINSKALLEHGVKVEKLCHISTGAIVNGGSFIGEGCFIGSGAVIAHGITVGPGSIIGAGAVVLSDVPEGHIVRDIWR